MTSRTKALQQIADIADEHQLQADEIIDALNQQKSPDQPEHGLLFMCAIMLLQQLLTFWATQCTVLL